jgi:hypothetical protein
MAGAGEGAGQGWAMGVVGMGDDDGLGLDDEAPSPVADLAAPLPATSKHMASAILAAASALDEERHVSHG